MAILAKIAKNDDFEASWNSGQKMARILAKIMILGQFSGQNLENQDDFHDFWPKNGQKWP